MNGINLQILLGNLGKSAEIRAIDGQRSKATFSVATNKTYKNREGQNITNTSWHNVVVWDPRIIDIVQRCCTTGRQVLVEGESTTRSYQDRNGQTQYIREVKASRVVPIDQIEEEVGEKGSIQRAYILGRIAEKPLLSTDENGVSRCTLIFKTEEGTFPVELTGPKAEVATRYLDVDRIAHVHYEITSLTPFKAVGLDLTLLGQRPADQGGIPTPQAAGAPMQSANTLAEEEHGNELDDLPF